MSVAQWMLTAGFEIKIIDKERDSYLNYDFHIVWPKNPGKYGPRRPGLLRFKIAYSGIVDYSEIEEYGPISPQFIVIPSRKDVKKSRVFRRGSVAAYCTAVLKNRPTSQDKKCKILNMKTYVDLEEFLVICTKVKLSNLEYSDEKFWKMFRFPMRDK